MQKEKERKKKEKHPFISLKKQEKQEKYHKMMRKVKKKLGGYREKEYIRCGYQAVGY